MTRIHGFIALFLGVGLFMVSGYGVRTLHRFTLYSTDRVVRRTVRLVVAAWVGLAVTLVHDLVMDFTAAFGPNQLLQKWYMGLTHLCELSMLFEGLIVLSLIREF